MSVILSKLLLSSFLFSSFSYFGRFLLTLFTSLCSLFYCVSWHRFILLLVFCWTPIFVSVYFYEVTALFTISHDVLSKHSSQAGPNPVLGSIKLACSQYCAAWVLLSGAVKNSLTRMWNFDKTPISLISNKAPYTLESRQAFSSIRCSFTTSPLFSLS